MLEQIKSDQRPWQENGACCIDTYRIFDSCRNQSCLEEMRLFFTPEGQKSVDEARTISVRDAELIHVGIQTEEMPFHKGYYQIRLRYFFCATLSCALGAKEESVHGVCTWDDSMILFGGEGGARSFCSQGTPSFQKKKEAPLVVVEAVEPVALRLNVLPKESAAGFGLCTLAAAEYPEEIASSLAGPLEGCAGEKICFLSLGLFSTVRIQRPIQLVVPACDYCIPEKRCEYDLPCTDPCSLFLSMDFPVKNFYPDSHPSHTKEETKK